VGACRQLHAAIDRLDELAAGMAGISRSDLRCLNLLEHGPLPATVIARQLNLATGSVTALIDRLESKALVTRLREEGDRRVVRVEATAKVFELIGPVYLGFANRLRLLVKGYPAADRGLAVQHLLDVAQACELAIAERQ
jgi:DNA-binding MarR family transcriptional regulator